MKNHIFYNVGTKINDNEVTLLSLRNVFKEYNYHYTVSELKNISRFINGYRRIGRENDEFDFYYYLGKKVSLMNHHNLTSVAKLTRAIYFTGNTSCKKDRRKFGLSEAYRLSMLVKGMRDKV